MHQFEIYLMGDSVSAEQWSKLYKSVVQYGKAFEKFSVIVQFTDNTIKYFIRTRQDISSLSNNLDGLIVRPVNGVSLPNASSKERFVKYVAGGNFLDLKEKYAVKSGKELGFAEINIRALGNQKVAVRMHLYFKIGDRWSKASKLLTFFPSNLLATDFSNNARYLKKTIPKYLNIEKSSHMLASENINALFEIDAFPYFSHNYFLNITSYDFDKHSFIVGASGSGKSKLISLLIDRLSRTALNMNYRVVVIDPHAALAEDLNHIANSTVIRFGKHDSTDLFPGAGTDLTAATELTATLFKSLLADQFNPRLDRLLRFSLFVLMTAQAMSLDNLKRFLTEVDYRNQIVSHVQGYVPDNVAKFFGADYNEFRTHYYNETILPLVSLVDEMQLQPSLVGEGDSSLARTIQDNFLTVFSLNKVSMGEKVVKTVAGLLIQQIFLLAQAKVFGQKVILIVDEVSVVQNPALAHILSEARKFNLTVILSQQYFGQVEKELRDAIFANVYNYYAFKVSEEDARSLEGNLNIELPKELIESEHKKGVKESDVKVKIMTELHPRECLVRLMSNGQMMPCLKARTVDAPSQHNEKAMTTRELKPLLPDKFVEGSKVGNRPINFSKEFLEQLANNADDNTVELHGGDPRPSKRNIASLREFLASQSSSRDKISKRKGDQ